MTVIIVSKREVDSDYSDYNDYSVKQMLTVTIVSFKDKLTVSDYSDKERLAVTIV